MLGEAVGLLGYGVGRGRLNGRALLAGELLGELPGLGAAHPAAGTTHGSARR